ncbi:MAG: dUTP diphosphatase [Deltaproteobacteria bacterium]|nr:dUTP diphosphatase [Deltaproteobacteria bacterium]
MDVVFYRLSHGVGLPLPSYATAGAAGMDLSAALEDELVLAPGQRCAVPTGFVLVLPEGFEGQVRARSGRALREGLTVLNGPGTVDSDYRGELKVLLVNLGDAPITLRRGERVAQLVVAPVVRAQVLEAPPDATPEATARATGGFGSTGK